MTIRNIHDFGPAVGQYVPSEKTDIRRTFARIAGTGSAPKPDDDAGIEVVELFGPDDLSPGLGAALTDTGAVFA